MDSLEVGSYALFFILSVMIIAFGIMMLVSKNYVHSAVFMAGALLSFSGIYALLSAPFIALLQLFIYAGAITMIVIFVIMMTRVGVEEWEELLQKQSWVAVIVVSVLSIGLVNTVLGVSKLLGKTKISMGSTVEMAQILFKKHYVEFEVASVILLVALIGAIYLAKEAKE